MGKVPGRGFERLLWARDEGSLEEGGVLAVIRLINEMY